MIFRFLFFICYGYVHLKLFPRIVGVLTYSSNPHKTNNELMSAIAARMDLPTNALLEQLNCITIYYLTCYNFQIILFYFQHFQM